MNARLSPTRRTPTRLTRRRTPQPLEFLEPRILLSAATAISPLAQLPNEATLTSPKFSDEWYFNNTGQTISDAVTGPSTGTPGADINALNAWDLTTGSRSVVIAV